METVIKRFPDYETGIRKLFVTSDFFRSICEDYAECVKVLENMDSADQMKRKGYREEYVGLLQDLEKELLDKLSKESISS